jgi:hypothetical protein
MEMNTKNLDDLFDEYALEKKLEKDLPLLESFCQDKGVEMIGYGVSFENRPSVELVYFFTDGLGGYNIEGVKNSMRE